MDERPEPRRIEIELTSHAPETVRREAQHRYRSETDHDAADADPDEPSRSRLDSERGRLVVGASAIGVTALLIGLFVGRLGSGDEVASSGTSSTTTSGMTATTDRSANTDTLPQAGKDLSSPTTTRPPRPEPVEAESTVQVKGVIDVAPSVAEMPIEVVAIMSGGNVMRIDVGTGATVSTSGRAAQLGPPAIHAGDGWILIPSLDERDGSTVLRDDGSRSSLDTGISWPLLTTGTPGQFWRGDDQAGNGHPSRLLETSIDTGDTGVAIELNGYFPRMVDPLGGVVIEAPGGSYVLGPETTTRITTGRLFALGRQRALVQECNEQLECGYFVVERSTGERRSLQLDRALGDRTTFDSGGWWTFQQPMSPTEDALLVVTWDQFGNGQQTHGILDLATGAFTEIGGAVEVPSMHWGPDGRSVFWIDRAQLRVFDLDTGESVLFSDELGTVRAFTIRSPSTSIAETEVAIATAPTSVAGG